MELYQVEATTRVSHPVVNNKAVTFIHVSDSDATFHVRTRWGYANAALEVINHTDDLDLDQLIFVTHVRTRSTFCYRYTEACELIPAET